MSKVSKSKKRMMQLSIVLKTGLPQHAKKGQGNCLLKEDGKEYEEETNVSVGLD